MEFLEAVRIASRQVHLTFVVFRVMLVIPASPDA
jgi:hypothetical protein